MNNDRFRFRVWSESAKKYYPEDAKIVILPNGKLIIETFFEKIEEDNPLVEFCTALKDKNGKLIFEGDVVRVKNKNVDYPVVVNERFISVLVFLDSPYNPDDYEIIGNIHEEEIKC